MLLTDIRVGDRLMVCAKDDFYAYVDGWRGRVTGFDQTTGLPVLVGLGMADAGTQSTDPATPEITLLVDPAQLAHTI